MTMTGARRLMKRYNLRPRPPDAATDAEHLQTTAPAAVTAVTTVTANENQRENADDTAEADSAHVGCDNHPAMTGEADIKPLRKLAHVSHAETGTERLQKTAPTATIDKSNRVHISKHIQRNNRNIFRFADLPAEIRNKIYNLSLTTNGQIPLKELRHGDNGRSHVTHRGSIPELGFITNLLLINKATYVEAGPILYSNNFYFSDSKAFFIFFARISNIAKSWVQELTLELPDGLKLADIRWILAGRGEDKTYLLPGFYAMVGTTNLKHLHIHFWDGGSSSFETSRFAPDMYGYGHFWFEAMKREKGSFKEVVELIDVKILTGSHDGTLDNWSKFADASRTSELREGLLQILHKH